MDHSDNQGNEWQVVDQKRDQMLRLVTRGFYHELVNYGVNREEILRVAAHLLDNLLSQPDRSAQAPEMPGSNLSLRSVQDRWKDERRLTIEHVTLQPLERSLAPRLSEWLGSPGVSESFVPPFPSGREALEQHFFGTATCDYLAIEVAGRVVGIVGGEGLDHDSGRIEMRKLVGDPTLRGQGIGKRATFGFLYYAFVVLGLHKVYVHSRDINVRNLNLNSSLEPISIGPRRARRRCHIQGGAWRSTCPLGSPSGQGCDETDSSNRACVRRPNVSLSRRACAPVLSSLRLGFADEG